MLLKKDFYLDEDRHESMTNRFYDGLMQGKFFAPEYAKSHNWEVQKRISRIELYDILKDIKLPEGKELGIFKSKLPTN